MQKVNLLPSDLAPPGLSEDLILLLRKAGVWLAVIFIVFLSFWVILRMELIRRDSVLSGMLREIKESDLLTENISDLKVRKDQLTQGLTDIKVYLSTGPVWSEKLLQLSRIMPEEAWLTRMSFSGQGRMATGGAFLDLEGALMPLKDTPPINTLSAFVDKLKQDEEFFSDFDELLISSIRAAKKKDIDITEFKIKLSLKKSDDIDMAIPRQ